MHMQSIIVLNAKWNRCGDENKYNEIYEIGAVKTAHFGGRVLDTFQAFVKTKALNDESSPIELRKLRSANGEAFPLVLERFLAWCGDDFMMASWGTNALTELYANAECFNLGIKLPTESCDLQSATSMVVGAEADIALHAIVEYFGIPDALDFKYALNDAFYAAAISEILMVLGGENVFKCATTASVPLLKPENLFQYIHKPLVRHGGFKQEKDVLRDNFVRNPPCFACGELLCISCWVPWGNNSFLAKATCKKHGTQYFWVTTSQAENGTWRGKMYALKCGPAISARYSLCDKKQSIKCQRVRPHRPHRRKVKNKDIVFYIG